jgi:hypothetical protein
MDSSIYVGTLRHRRFSPVRHDFTYPLFMVFLEIDRLPELMRISPLASYNRCNLVSYDEREHFGDPRLPLRERLAEDAASHGVALAPGPIHLLTHLRFFNYSFNPVSFFYVTDGGGVMRQVLAEVNNTFGETHNYWLGPEQERRAHADDAPRASKHYTFEKRFHVSPFLGMDQEYAWTFTPPEDRLQIHCINYQDGREVFDATLSLDRREWNRRELHRALRQIPWMTAKVVASIHWQAMKLKFKGVPVVPHPGAGQFQPVHRPHWGVSWKPQAGKSVPSESAPVNSVPLNSAPLESAPGRIK